MKICSAALLACLGLFAHRQLGLCVAAAPDSSSASTGLPPAPLVVLDTSDALLSIAASSSGTDTSNTSNTSSNSVGASHNNSNNVGADLSNNNNATVNGVPAWATVDPTSVFEATDAARQLWPPRFVAPAASAARAIPTNNWWGNLIAHDSGAKIQPVWANPYALQVVADAAPFGLAASYPFRSRTSGGSSGNSGAVRYYAHSIVRELLFSADEFASAKPDVRVVDWSDQGVQLELTAASGKGSLQTDLVSGMVYVSAQYTSLTPRLASAAAVTRVNGQAVKPGNVVRGSRFEVTYNSGQTWVVYALAADARTDQSIALRVESDGSTLAGASGAFDGTLRAALALEPAWLPTLDKHRLCVVQSAAVTIASDTSYAFEWQTHGDCARGLLHFAMQHHAASLDASGSGVTKVDGLVAHSTTRGAYQAYATLPGASLAWQLRETQAVPDSFFPPRKLAPAVVQAQQLREHLRRDIVDATWSMPLDGSYYFNGKAAQKYASLCLMASDAAVVGDDKALLQTCLNKLRTALAPFVANRWKHKLAYDRVYRGVVSTEGHAKRDPNADFGNSMYNDHHFHYGYWIYAAAVVNTLDPTWSDLPQLNVVAGLLARDVANFDASDAQFPRFRAFDWFRGHSYSHGVTPFADGKDQESTSEDVNFAFALYLFGKATNHARMATVGTLMTRVNARAIKTYFLIDATANTVHPANFRANKVTGIFFDNKVDYATWFSAEKHCIHGIQMLPVSAVTEFVRTRAFVQQEWDTVLQHEPIVKRQDTGNTWLSLLYASYAAVDKAAAMRVLQKTKMDDGLSRAWALYMAASQPE